MLHTESIFNWFMATWESEESHYQHVLIYDAIRQRFGGKTYKGFEDDEEESA